MGFVARVPHFPQRGSHRRGSHYNNVGTRSLSNNRCSCAGACGCANWGGNGSFGEDSGANPNGSFGVGSHSDGAVGANPGSNVNIAVDGPSIGDAGASVGGNDGLVDDGHSAGAGSDNNGGRLSTGETGCDDDPLENDRQRR